MLGWALVFAVLAIVAGILGFVSLAGLAAGIAKILFVVFLVLLVAGFAIRAFRGSNAIADILVGLDIHGNLRVICTSNGEGDGDHAIALFPELPADEMVKRTVCDLPAEKGLRGGE